MTTWSIEATANVICTIQCNTFSCLISVMGADIEWQINGLPTQEIIEKIDNSIAEGIIGIIMYLLLCEALFTLIHLQFGLPSFAIEFLSYQSCQSINKTQFQSLQSSV